MTELRLVRTLERIDALKEEGRWSFRQPKKQRGVGGLNKTHWDYLIDEMVKSIILVFSQTPTHANCICRNGCALISERSAGGRL